MAIDGVKIVDSDSAYGIYNSIMEMYHFGESLEKIRKEIDQAEADYVYSDLEQEIYTTTYALAMWEIGGLLEEQLQKTRDIVGKGASKQWEKIAPDALKERQNELEKLLRKIEHPNLKVKKRKNYKKPTEYIFNPSEVLVFQFEDKTFGAVIHIESFQEGKTLYYAFAEVILRTSVKPTMQDILLSKVHARINIGFDAIKIVSHKNLLKFQDKFEKLGTVSIKKANNGLGVVPPDCVTFEEFCDSWNWDGGRMKRKIRELAELLE